MNLVGKIFVGIIALMSVVCLTVSAMSFASHHNWKAKSDELKAKLDEVEAQKKQLNEQKAELNAKIAAESQAYVQAIEALKTKADDLEKQNEQLTATNKGFQEEIAAKENIIIANNELIADYRAELETTSKNLAEATQARGSYLQQLAQAVEQLHESSTQYGDLSEKTEALEKLLDEMIGILNKNGMSTDPNDYSELPQFACEGTIQNVSKDYDGMLLITIGSDDGLAENNRLDVRRGDSYLGKIEVVSVEPNRAVCRVLPEYRQGVMMEGDSVYAAKVN